MLYTTAPGGSQAVAACSRRAAQYGIRLGMPLAEARALGAPRGGQPTAFAPYDPQADREALGCLAVWCQQFSPVVALATDEPPDSLLLDITGCAHLFGGEPGLVQRAVAELRPCGYVARVALADTPGAAWAIAHYAALPDGTAVVPPGQQEAALAPLPVEALRLPADVLPALHDLDLRRVEQVLKLPRATLPSRFGPVLLRRLDQALGRLPEVLTPVQPAEPIAAEQAFETPLASRQLLEAVLERLLEQVLARLQDRERGMRQFVVTLHFGKQQDTDVVVSLLTSSDSLRYLMHLLRLRLDAVRWRLAVQAVTVSVVAAPPLDWHQQTLFPEETSETERDQHLAQLIEVLSNRLGEEAVVRPQLLPDAQPEFAYRYEPRLRPSPAAGSPPAPLPLSRPLDLKREPLTVAVTSVVPDGPPLRFSWQGREHTVAHYWGPERIEAGWWREREARRDYYRVETQTGERFWLFRDRDSGDWFLHGTFA
ncbi:MAG: DNA polymerase Y family protein [Planctomycetia bacterium]|nr:DNA polymerase Y family protein [Planctomycetia bacterium]